MKDAFWFQHDSNARSDSRILELRAEMGWEGYGLWWALVEQLREATDYQLSNIEMRGLAMGLAVTKPEARKFIDLCIELGLLTVEGDYFFASALRRRMERWDTKRSALSEAGKRGAGKRWAGEKPADTPAEALPEPPQKPADSQAIATPLATPIARREEKSTEEITTANAVAATGGQAGDSSPADLTSSTKPSPLGGAAPAPPKPREYGYDEAPIFMQATFFDYLKSIGYGHVDRGMYLLQIQAVGREKMITTTDERWRGFIKKFLNNDRLKNCLIMPQAEGQQAQQQRPVSQVEHRTNVIEQARAMLQNFPNG